MLMKISKPVRLIFSVSGVLLITLFILAFIGWRQSQKRNETLNREQAAIDSLYVEFEGYIREGDFANAYKLMSPSYRTTDSLKDFINRFDFLQAQKDYRLHPHRYLKVEDDQALLFPKDTSIPGNWHGVGFEFQKIEGVWYLTGEWVHFQD